MKDGTRVTFVLSVWICPCQIQTNVKEALIRNFEIIRYPDSQLRGIAHHDICDDSPKELESDFIRAFEIKENYKEKKAQKESFLETKIH